MTRSAYTTAPAAFLDETAQSLWVEGLNAELANCRHDAEANAQARATLEARYSETDRDAAHEILRAVKMLERDRDNIKTEFGRLSFMSYAIPPVDYDLAFAEILERLYSAPKGSDIRAVPIAA